ncbi:hypothetical protein ANANG_G00182320 [Anguilla anguilla]|uniref:RUN domain-containing protein n=1 Tax=Anguilla anguilla TaxID=7936 RepID=A0A9D3M8N0_ANGAN|nr:hypothetical protein ANANG_G00182320 [Anguilla anguilla]
MLSQPRPAVPPQPCQSAGREQGAVELKSPELSSWRDDINMNTTANTSASSHQGYANSGPAESVRSRAVDQGLAAVDQQKDCNFAVQNHKPNIVHLAADPSSALDPNCNEPSLPCLCCNGYSPQDNNSTYNLNYINNNTVAFGQQTQSSCNELYQEGAHQAQKTPKLTQLPHSAPSGEEVDKTDDEDDTQNRKEVSREDYADEDDTLIPSCWDCPPSLLEFSLSSFTSSSSTSISGCSDLESDCPDAISLSCQDFPPEQSHSFDDRPHASVLESYRPRESPLPVGSPLVLSTPSSDSTEEERSLEDDDGLLDLQKLSESVDELGKAIHRQAAQLAQWDLEGYLELRDELDHLEGLGLRSDPRGLEQFGSVFGEANLGHDGCPSEGETSSRPLDCSDAGAESCASSVFDDCVFQDLFVSSPLLPPPQPTMLPVVDRDAPAFTYMNMNASTPSPPTTSSTYSSSPSFTPTLPAPPPPSFHALDDEIRKLLILAGVTQDELLKLGPELGVGVMELMEPEGAEVPEPAGPGEAEGSETRAGFRGQRPSKKRRPERFDWLIEFSPDTDAVSKPGAVDGRGEGGAQKLAAGAKVTTFKELRRQSRQNPAPAAIHKEPDPAAVTPDPDFLYSLKWATEGVDGDDPRWEYGARARTSVLQPPPVTPLAPLREMLPAGRGGPCPTLSPHWLLRLRRRLRTAAEEREEAEATKRGRADGGLTLDSGTAVCSLSFAESVQRGGALATDGVRAQLGGQGLFSPCMQEKRALLSPISLAVDAILAQFNSSRTLVQKVQSGDSRVNPSLGRLVLQCLCPALSGLLADGLRPYQTDLITGRRPNSPWGLVQACTGPGPSTQAMHSLQCQVSQLPQLRQSRHRFNAFLLGLLNIKLLDHWVFHLQSCDDVLDTHYHPTSFMWLSRTSCQPLFEELLLLLQPLSLLTFNIDLLFQHHHFDPASPTPSAANYGRENAGPANRACSFRIPGLSCWRRDQSWNTSKQAPGVSDDQQKTKLTALANNSNNGLNGRANGSPVSANKGEAANHILWKEWEIAPHSVDNLSQQAGQTVQQGWGSVVQWGRKVGQSWGSYNKAEQKASPLPPDSWLSNAPLEYDYITHEAQRNPVPECNSAAPWVLGMLFGASRGQKDPRRCPTSARRPSHWLAPGVSVLSRIAAPAQNSESGEREKERERERAGEREHPTLARPVRTQRDHRPRGQLY